MIRTTDKWEFHTENPKIHCAILYRKDPLNLLCQWQYAILIDTTRQKTIVKLTMRCSIDIGNRHLVSLNGNLMFEKNFF